MVFNPLSQQYQTVFPTHLLQKFRFQISGAIPESPPLIDTQGLLQQFGHIRPQAQRILHHILVLGKYGNVVLLQDSNFQGPLRALLLSLQNVLHQIGRACNGLTHIHIGGNKPGLLLAGAGDDVGIPFRRNPDAFKANVKMPPMGHYANPETEIGRVCVQLAMPDFKYLSGETLTLEGGMGLRP